MFEITCRLLCVWSPVLSERRFLSVLTLGASLPLSALVVLNLLSTCGVKKRCGRYTAAGFSGRMPMAELADAIVESGRQTLVAAARTVSPLIKEKEGGGVREYGVN